MSQTGKKLNKLPHVCFLARMCLIGVTQVPSKRAKNPSFTYSVMSQRLKKTNKKTPPPPQNSDAHQTTEKNKHASIAFSSIFNILAGCYEQRA